jgi:VCBS repeat-containing protein
MATWDGSSSTSWHVGANWDIGDVPGSGDTVNIVNAGYAPLISLSVPVSDLNMSGNTLSVMSQLFVDYDLDLTGGFLGIGPAGVVYVGGTAELSGGTIAFAVNGSSTYGSLSAYNLELGSLIQVNVTTLAAGTTLTLIDVEDSGGTLTIPDNFTLNADVNGLDTMANVVGVIGKDVVLKTFADNTYDASAASGPLFYYFDSRLTGDDRLSGGGFSSALYQTANNISTIVGTSFDDLVYNVDFGGTGDAVRDMSIEGGDGNDTISAGSGTDSVLGGTGDDYIIVFESDRGSGQEHYDGGDDADILLVDDDDATSAGAYIVDLRGDTVLGMEAIAFGYADLGSAPQLRGRLEIDAASMDGITNVYGNQYDDDQADELHVYMGERTSFSFAGITFSDFGGTFDGTNVYGDGDAESITGAARGDFISSGGGDDTLTGGLGNDMINGGGGTADIARFTGNWSEYTISFNGTAYTITDTVVGRDGTDYVTDVEFFSFNGILGSAGALLLASPVALDDDNSGDAVREAGSLGRDDTATGNVLANDTDPNVPFDSRTVTGIRTGAETAGGTLGAPGVIVGTYGSLNIAADGTWLYTLDNADADTEALRTGDVVTDIFTYGMSDGFPHSDTAQLTITIHGSNETGRNIKGTNRSDSITEKSKSSKLRSTEDDDTIKAANGNDTIKAGRGDDLVKGGRGNDELYGQSGADRFYFAELSPRDADTIRDFKSGVDKIVLDGDVFDRIGDSLSTREFLDWSRAPKAKDKYDRIIYDTDSGNLYYDADGRSSKSSPVLIAILDSKSGPPALAYTDFIIV